MWNMLYSIVVAEDYDNIFFIQAVSCSDQKDGEVLDSIDIPVRFRLIVSMTTYEKTLYVIQKYIDAHFRCFLFSKKV